MIQRFLGFVEGRLRIELPAVWQQSLLHLRAHAPDRLHIAEFQYWPYHETDAGFSTPLSVAAATGEDQFVISTESGQCVLPKKIARAAFDAMRFNLCAILDDDLCVYGFFGPVGYSFPIHCVDAETGKERWSREVFAGYYGGTTGTGYEHRVTMRLAHGKVYVFGACLMGSYVEVFSLANGRPICRFTTATSI